MATHWSVFGNVIHLHRRADRRARRADARLDPRPRGLAPLGLRSRLMAASDTQPVRMHLGAGVRGPGRAARRDRRPARHRRHQRPGDRGRHRPRCCSPGCSSTAYDLGHAIWTASTTRRWRSRTPGSSRIAEGLAPFENDYSFLGDPHARCRPGQHRIPRHLRARRASGAHPRKWSVHVKLTLVTSLILIVAGAVLYICARVRQPEDLRRSERRRHRVPVLLPVGDDALRRVLDHRHRRPATARACSSPTC